jgi:hypothetical protein
MTTTRPLVARFTVVAALVATALLLGGLVCSFAGAAQPRVLQAGLIGLLCVPLARNAAVVVGRGREHGQSVALAGLISAVLVVIYVCALR